jgi:ABC-type amino acid transport substrate-binding protein
VNAAARALWATLAAGAALALLPPPSSRAESGMLYVFNAPESALDVRYQYHWTILRTALEKTSAQWGPFRMLQSAPMTEKRQAYELKQRNGTLTVMYLGTTPEFEREFYGIHIPVDRNLGGYNVFLVRSDRRADFHDVRTLEDLKRFSFGLGLGWLDVEILRHNGLRVVTGSSYDGLFDMLVHRRFDVFLRAAVEVLDETAQRSRALPQLWIEDSLVLYYPLPMYFWFPKTAEGKRLAERAEQGMRAMIADGSYDQIFDHYQRHKIERLHLATRRILRIENPLLGPETPLADKRLWFDPESYR